MTSDQLGSDSWLRGTAVRGAGRGKGLGFPTANVQLRDGQERPADGIYAGWVQLLPDEQQLPAAIHVGPVPTFDQTEPTVEAHIIDWSGEDLYGRDLALQFVEKLRGVVKFASEVDLIEALAKDVQAARELLKKY